MPTITDLPNRAVVNGGVFSVTIPVNGSTSDALFVNGASIVGLCIDTLTSATLTFQMSIDGETFYDKNDLTGSPISIPAVSGANYDQLGNIFLGDLWVKVKTSIPQPAGASFKFVLMQTAA